MPAAPRRVLSLFDSSCIIVGIIIGSSLYESSPLVASSLGGPWALLGAWALGGLLTLVGAFCYVELATTYPVEGGDYAYLTRAFGRPVGFLFAWALFWVIFPGSVGAMVFVFARYAAELFGPGPGQVGYAAAAIVGLTLVNLLGIRTGKWTQNTLTTLKVLGLLAVVAAGLFWSSPSTAKPPAAPSGTFDFRLAMILILYAYSGWHEMAYVAAEVRDPQKNIWRALILGTLLVTAIYLAATAAFIHALGYDGFCGSQAVAADALRLGLGPWGGRLISILICISALGVVNGIIFTGARVTYAMGKDHRLYAWVGQWSERRGVPTRALVLQAAVALGLVFSLGASDGGFARLANFTSPVFWSFFFLVGLALFVLRWREPDTVRPYRAPGYPLTPALFCLSSLFMVYASVTWAWDNRSYEGYWAAALLGAGVLLAIYESRRGRLGDA